MQAHRIETVIPANGSIVLENLPFKEGERVEIIVLERRENASQKDTPLAGALLKYEDPFGPATAT